ncbi:MAG: hypothetical protein U0798_15175 [Gemmataceae bacterium]
MSSIILYQAFGGRHYQYLQVSRTDGVITFPFDRISPTTVVPPVSLLT